MQPTEPPILRRHRLITQGTQQRPTAAADQLIQTMASNLQSLAMHAQTGLHLADPRANLVSQLNAAGQQAKNLR